MKNNHVGKMLRRGGPMGRSLNVTGDRRYITIVAEILLTWRSTTIYQS
jgi:hypothetical protein